MSNLFQDFFGFLDDFAHRDLFQNSDVLWDPLNRLGAYIPQILTSLKSENSWEEPSTGIKKKLFQAREDQFKESCLMIEDWFEAKTPIFFPTLGIWIGQGTILEPTSIIKGPAVIGEFCDIRQGAYIRGNVLTGNHCVIGHATEVKNSILMNHSESGHFNYIGDSIIGSYVNMGAGSKLANLQFRTLEEKKEDSIRPIIIKFDNKIIDTQRAKLGGILGDNVELGCNAVVFPGSLVGKNSIIYPNSNLPKGYYPPGTTFGKISKS